MTKLFFRFYRRIKRRFISPLRIPSDNDLSDALFLLYEEKLSTSGGESHMLRDSAAQGAFDRTCVQMSISPAELVRIIGILRSRNIIDAKVYQERDIIQLHYIQLGFSALSFVQETASRRRRFWLNSVFFPIFLAFVTALFTSVLSQEQVNQKPCNYPNQCTPCFTSSTFP